MSIILEQKRSVESKMKDDIENAFIALGGSKDDDKGIDLEQVKEIIKREFDMDIDMSKLIRNYGENESQNLRFDEFRDLMSN